MRFLEVPLSISIGTSPITKHHVKRDSLRRKCGGEKILTLFYTDDFGMDPNINPPFNINDVLTRSDPIEESMYFGPNDIWGVATCSLGPCDWSGWEKEELLSNVVF